MFLVVSFREEPPARPTEPPSADEALSLQRFFSDLPSLDPANNHRDRVLTFFWTKKEFETVRQWHFFCFELTKYLGIPVRMVVVENDEDWEKQPLDHGRVIFGVNHHNVGPLVNLARRKIRQPYGFLIASDELGKFNQSEIADASLIIRPYYFQKQYVNEERVIYVPTGYLLGRGPWDPNLLIPASERRLGCWFSGSLRAERKHLQEAFEKVNVSGCKIEITRGFTLGLPADRYSFQMQDTKLSLCPAGNSPETIRLYESWENGAVPVMTEGDFAKGQFAVTHPGMNVILVPSWQEAPKLVGEWLEPANAEKLDELQAENIAWYQQYKHDLRIKIARGIRSRL